MKEEEDSNSDTKLIKQVIEVAKSSKDDEALKKIAQNPIRVGAFEQAAETARSITNSLAKSDALEKISNKLIEVGKLRAASNVARGIEDDETRANILCDAASRLLEAGEFEKATEVATGVKDYRRSVLLQDIATKIMETIKASDGVETNGAVDRESKSLPRPIRRDEVKENRRLLSRLVVEEELFGQALRKLGNSPHEDALGVANRSIDEFVDVTKRSLELGEKEFAKICDLKIGEPRELIKQHI